MEKFPNHAENKKHIFLSSAPNELHSLGIEIAGIILRKLGFQVTNLGIDIAPKEIKKAIRKFQPDLIIFSATLQTSIVDIALLIDQLQQNREIFTKDFSIGIGGNGFSKLTNPVQMFHADFYIKEMKDFINIK